MLQVAAKVILQEAPYVWWRPVRRMGRSVLRFTCEFCSCLMCSCPSPHSRPPSEANDQVVVCKAWGCGEDATTEGRLRQARLVRAQEAGDGLLVGMEAGRAGRATTDEARAAQWFAQDDFAAAPTLESAAAGVGPPHLPAPPRPRLCCSVRRG